MRLRSAKVDFALKLVTVKAYVALSVKLSVVKKSSIDTLSHKCDFIDYCEIEVKNCVHQLCTLSCIHIHAYTHLKYFNCIAIKYYPCGLINPHLHYTRIHFLCGLLKMRLNSC